MRSLLSTYLSKVKEIKTILSLKESLIYILGKKISINWENQTFISSTNGNLKNGTSKI